VYEKTGKGTEEIQTRKYGLLPKPRSILVAIDGKLDKGAILSEFAAMEGAADALDELERQGFIAKRADVFPPGVLSPEEEQRRFPLAKAFMVNSTLYALGPMASGFVELLEKCTTLAELQGHLEEYLKGITTGSGHESAEKYAKELAKLFPPKIG
jgi:hypothetical protein